MWPIRLTLAVWPLRYAYRRTFSWFMAFWGELSWLPVVLTDSDSAACRCKTVSRLEEHHLHQWLARDHPIVICVRTHPIPSHPSHTNTAALFCFRQTDDTLPFQTTLRGEYALLLAQPPHGLGMPESAVGRIAEMGMGCAFERPGY